MKWLIKLALLILGTQPQYVVKTIEKLRIEAKESADKKALRAVPEAIELLKDKDYIVYPKTKAQRKKTK